MERWILVADASRARLFRQQQKQKQQPLDHIESFEHPDSRARARDLMADSNGRKPAGPDMGPAYGGRSVSHSYGRVGAAPDTDPKTVEAQKFARELATMLQDGLHRHAYDKVVLVAPPQFLGLLRSTVSNEVSKHIETTINKDLTRLELHELQGHLQDELPAAPPA